MLCKGPGGLHSLLASVLLPASEAQAALVRVRVCTALDVWGLVPGACVCSRLPLWGQVEAELAAATSQLSEATSKAREAVLLLDSSTIANTHR